MRADAEGVTSSVFRPLSSQAKTLASVVVCAGQ